MLNTDLARRNYNIRTMDPPTNTPSQKDIEERTKNSAKTRKPKGTSDETRVKKLPKTKDVTTAQSSRASSIACTPAPTTPGNPHPCSLEVTDFKRRLAGGNYVEGRLSHGNDCSFTQQDLIKGYLNLSQTLPQPLPAMRSVSLSGKT